VEKTVKNAMIESIGIWGKIEDRGQRTEVGIRNSEFGIRKTERQG
jgi:hypothetical protein